MMMVGSMWWDEERDGRCLAGPWSKDACLQQQGVKQHVVEGGVCCKLKSQKQ